MLPAEMFQSKDKWLDVAFIPSILLAWEMDPSEKLYRDS